MQITYRKRNGAMLIAIIMLLVVFFVRLFAKNPRDMHLVKSPSVDHVPIGSVKSVTQDKQLKTKLTPEHYFRRRKSRVTPLNFKYSITAALQSTVKSAYVIILVNSQCEHSEERNSIRDTWGSVSRTLKWGRDRVTRKISILFIMGNADRKSESEMIKKENEKYGDIVQMSFKDTSINVAYKILGGFEWIKTYAPKTKYVVKVDDDIFLNIPNLLKTLDTLDLRNTVLGSYVEQTEARGEDHRTGAASYPLSIYPPHVESKFYVMPTTLTLQILNVAEFMPYVAQEDVYITGILVKVVGGKHVGVSAVGFDPSRGAPGVCDFRTTSVIAAQSVTPKKASDIWKTVTGAIKC